MPAVEGGQVAVTYGRLRTALLDADDGALLWETERRNSRDVAPLLTADLVLAPTEDGVLALDRASGAVRWDADVGERANTPVVVEGLAVVSTWDESVIAFDLADGRVAWRVALPGIALGPPASDGEAVVVTWEAIERGEAGLLVVEGASGDVRWSVPLEPGGTGGPAVVGTADGPVAVVVAGDVAAHGYSLVDGSRRWRLETSGAGSAEVPPLPVAGGGVLVAHRLGGLVLVDAATGKPGWSVSSDGAAVRGGPAGPSGTAGTGADPQGPFAFPLDDGRLLVAGPGRPATALDWPGRVSGVAVSRSGLLLVATREASQNHLIALSEW